MSTTEVAVLGGDFKVTKKELENIVVERHDEGVQKWWKEEMGGLQGLAKVLKTDTEKGICDSEADLEIRYQNFGYNILPQKEMAGFFELLYEALKDPTLLLLLVCALITIGIGATIELEHNGWIEGVAICVSVAAASGVTAGQDWHKERQFQKLNKVKDERMIKVVRNAENTTIKVDKITAGDIIKLATGDFVPADGILVKGFDLECDESSMTGESDAIKKNETTKNIMISGTKVQNGSGYMMATGVGENSEWGVLVAKLQDDAEDTPLQIKLTALATLIGKIGLFFAGLTVIGILIGVLIDGPYDDTLASKIISAFIIGITILVVAVPEGLPLAVTIALAYSMQKMLKDQNLVRKLQACETMGGATNICSDKTGTLTQNRMSVIEGWLQGQPCPDINNTNLDEAYRKLLQTAVCVNSDAEIQFIDKKGPAGEMVKVVDFVGSPTECALLQMTEKLSAEFSYKETREAHPIIRLHPFSSAKKRMSTIVKYNGANTLFVKGAAEMVLSLCTKTIDTSGNVITLESTTKNTIATHIQTLAEKGLRTIVVASRTITDAEVEMDDTEVEKELELIALVGIADPERPEVPGAVLKCQDAGIIVRMVTGDNILTAKTIAKKCHILTDGIAMEGPKFRQLSDEEMDKALPKLQVLARSSPTDKYLLVSKLIEKGEVVAVTGDGTNDAPALKKADVGLSMGIAGTDVAKEASDIVIMDDNFSSIVQAVLWGRNVYDSIRKFLQFQVTVNIVALFTNAISAFSQRGAPLTAVQLLWVNLIMDTMAALALATETPTPDMLLRKPYKRDDPLMTRRMWRFVGFQSGLQLIVMLVIIYGGEALFGFKEGDCFDYRERVGNTREPCEHYTLVFNVFVFMQVFNEFNARVILDEINVFKGVFGNSIFISVIIITCIVQVILVQFGDIAVSVTPLERWDYWVATLIFGIAAWPVCVLSKMVKHPYFDESPSSANKNYETVPQEAPPAGTQEAWSQ
eukprot:GFYU01003055.1.p1 GENE.GFYU01003055.1~~GFYU01003055.1.p1  ORF type:complete len:980 (-),score=391.20 GFYU01003055.1:461-3400(-)